MISSAAKSSVFSKARRPHSSSLRASSARSCSLRHAAHRRENPVAVARDRADDRVAGRLGVAGLHAVGADPHLQQRVAVRLGDLVPGELALAVESVIFRIFLPDMPGERDELTHRDDLAFCRQAVGILEHRFGEPDLARALGHQRGKILLRSGQAFGDSDAGIVGRLDDHALDQVLDPDLRVELGEHGRAARLRAAFRPGVLADGERVVHRQPADFQRMEHHFHRHQLGERGGRDELVGVLRIEDRAGLGVDHHGLFGARLEQLGLRLRLRRPNAQGSENHRERDDQRKCACCHKARCPAVLRLRRRESIRLRPARSMTINRKLQKSQDK